MRIGSRTPTKRVAALVAMVAVLVMPAAFAGCSGGNHAARPASTTTTGASDTACRLVTAADAARLFGEPAVRAAVTTRAVGASSVCVYDVASTSGQLLQFRVYQNNQYYARSEHPDAVEVAGLGDEAFVSRSGPSGLVDCQFAKGGVVYSFAYSNLTGNAPTRADALVALARQVATRA